MSDNQATIEELRQRYPHGHPDFIPLTVGEMGLHSDKNRDYAAGGPPLGNFDRRAAIARIYKSYGHPIDLSDPVQVAMWDAFKQLDAAIWMLTGDYEGAVEGVEARMGDVSVYVKLARILYRQRQETAGGECCQSSGCGCGNATPSR